MDKHVLAREHVVWIVAMQLMAMPAPVMLVTLETTVNMVSSLFV